MPWNHRNNATTSSCFPKGMVYSFVFSSLTAPLLLRFGSSSFTYPGSSMMDVRLLTFENCCSLFGEK